MFIGMHLIFPAISRLSGVYGAGKAPQANQAQLFIGGLAVIWALKGAWDKLRETKDG
jgi:hypothetical protein